MKPSNFLLIVGNHCRFYRTNAINLNHHWPTARAVIMNNTFWVESHATGFDSYSFVAISCCAKTKSPISIDDSDLAVLIVKMLNYFLHDCFFIVSFSLIFSSGFGSFSSMPPMPTYTLSNNIAPNPACLQSSNTSSYSCMIPGMGEFRAIFSS